VSFPDTWRRWDLWALGAGVAAVLLFSLHGFDRDLGRDTGLYAYAGQRVVEGEPPYVGVLNRAGPLAHLLPAVGVGIARLGGFDDLTTVRVFFLLLGAATVGVGYLLGRDAFRSRGAGAVVAAAMLSWHGFGAATTSGPSEKTVMVLFVLIALWATARRRWATAGVFVGLATLTLQTAFFVAAVAGLVAASGEPGRARRVAVLRFGAGGLASLLAFVAYFALVGALGEFLDGFVLINAEYTEGAPIVNKLGRTWEHLTIGFGVSLPWLFAGLAAVLVLPLLSLRDGRRRSARAQEAPTMLLVAFAAATLSGLGWAFFRDFDSWPDAFVMLPMAALGLGGAADLALRRSSARTGAVLVAVVVAVAVTSALASTARERPAHLDEQRRSVAAARSGLPGATIVSIEAPQALVLAQQRNPSRHQMFSAGLSDYIDDTWPGGLRGYRDWVVGRERPELVAVGSMERRWIRRLRPDYTVVGEAPTWSWMARTSLGEDTLAGLRAAFRAPRPAR
jgi:hypothetical protein